MKRLSKSLIALMIAVVMLSSVFSVFFVSNAGTLVYSKTENSGERDVICTTLDGTSAAAYYTGSNSYATLSGQSSSQLLSSLRTLMRSTHKKTSSYNNCRDMAPETDCENENGKITMIYTSYQASVSQYQSGQGWNREHVWPQSLGGNNTSGGGADLHHIRPSESKTNSTRGNKKYGNAPSGKTVTGNLSGEVGGTYGTYYEPNDNVKGDVARICLYVYVRWGSDWGADSITEVFESVDVLLEWCALDPVDTWEMGRNEVIAAYQGNRNVFIDYPEFAFLMFGEDVPEDMTTPSNGKTSGGSTVTTTTTATTTTKPTPVLPPVTPSDPNSTLLTTDSIRVYRQTKDQGTTNALRVLFVANQIYLYEHTKLTLTITFQTANGTKTYTGVLAAGSDDFTLYQTVTALGEPYHADTGCLIFGVAIVGIPKTDVTSATIVLTDATNTPLSQGKVTFS